MRFLRRGSDLGRAADIVALDDEEGPARISPAARIATGANEDPPADDPPADPPADDPPADDPPADDPPPAAADEATIRAEERQRVTDVFASDAAKGKERIAAQLLANPKLEASEIIALLPTLTSGNADAMLGRLAEQPNPDLAPGSEAGAGGGDSKASWDRTFERLGWDGKTNNK